MESTSTREHNLLHSLPSQGVIFIFLSYAILRLWQVYHLIPFATKWVDSGSYLFVARQPFLSPQFLAGSRPLTIALVFKLAGQDPVGIAWWQGCISIISWGFLIYQVIRFIENRALRWLGLGCLMLFSLVYNISDQFMLGAMEGGDPLGNVSAMDEATAELARLRQKGLIRLFGFSAHNPDYGARMLEQWPIFDTVMVPYNHANRAAERGLAAVVGRLRLRAIRPLA